MAVLLSATVRGLAGSKRPKTIEFQPKVNAVWGLNGSGKTSYIKVLHSALTNDSSILVRVPFESAVVRFLDHRTGNVYERSIIKNDLFGQQAIFDELLSTYDLESISAEERHSVLRQLQRAAAKRAVGRSGEVSVDDWGWKTTPEPPPHTHPAFMHRYLPTSRLTAGTDPRMYRTQGASADRADVLTEATYDKVFARNIQAIWERYSRQELIQEREIQQAGLASILSSVLNRGEEFSHGDGKVDAEAAYKALTGFFRAQKLPVQTSRSHFMKSYQSDPLLRNVVARITDVERQIGKAQAPSRKLESLLHELFNGGKQVRLDKGISVSSRAENIPIELLSSGEKQMLLILLEALAAGDHSIIIDEPEISMHVDWQRRLVESMRIVNPEAQIVIATHSPEVMAGVPETSIFEL
jgi:energy-coupling factor transporter ATP-binding protein EcfA2